MNSIRSFLAWWLGELRLVFSGRARSPLSLAMSSKEVALIERGIDNPLGVVELADPDYAVQIEGLRSIAEKRAGPSAPVEVRLPLDQVRFLDLDSPVSETGVNNAAVRVADEIDRKAGDLVVVPGPSVRRPNEKIPQVIVATTLKSTIAEAVAHARNWGFQPLRVTSADWPPEFVGGPNFYASEGRVRSPLISRVIWGLTALTVLLIASAAALALGTRGSIAEATRLQAEEATPLERDMGEVEIRLANYAHSASAAIEGRTETVPVWYLLSELAAVMPGDIALDSVKYRPGTVSVEGRGTSLDLMARAMERSPLFSEPRIIETRVSSKGIARFRMDITVNARGPL